MAASGVAAKMVLTDGNAISVNNVQVSLERNDLPTETTARQVPHSCKHFRAGNLVNMIARMHRVLLNRFFTSIEFGTRNTWLYYVN